MTKSSKPSKQIGDIIDKFHKEFNCDENNSSITIRDYQIDEIRSFQVIIGHKDSLEIHLAGVLYDYNETTVKEYMSPGEAKEYDDDRDESEKNTDKVVM